MVVENKTKLREGDVAPDFSLLDHAGQTKTLSSFVREKVLLVFYPKDRTPCCRREKIALRDKLLLLQQSGITVVVVSADQTLDHAVYVREYSIEFPLLKDPDNITAKQYGLVETKYYRDKAYTAVKPTAFLIDRGRNIEKIFPNFNLELEALSVLKQF